MPDAFIRALAEFGLLASAPEPFDPMEKAFHALGREQLGDANRQPHAGWTLAHAYGLRPDLLAVTHVWQPDAGRQQFVVAAKGAPEAIAGLCHLGAADRAALTQSIDAMAAARPAGIGRRARRHSAGRPWPDSPRDFAFEFLGLVGLADPLRPSVVEAIARLPLGRHPGRDDHRRLSRDRPRDRAPGRARRPEKSSPATNSRNLTTTGLARRATHDDRLRADHAGAEAAHRRGAEGERRDRRDDRRRRQRRAVAEGRPYRHRHGRPRHRRGARGFVDRAARRRLRLDRQGVRLGRRIYDNLRKAMGFIFAVHVPIAGLALLPLLLGLPILFGPIHIAFLEMVIDPVCSLVFEAETEEDDVMRRPPRAPDEPLVLRPLIVWSVLQGVLAFALIAAIYVLAYRSGMPEQEVRALAFFSLVVAIVSLILVNRSFSASLADGAAAAERDLGSRAVGCRRHPGADPAGAICKQPLRLWAAACRRPRFDAWRRSCHPGFARTLEADLAFAAALLELRF